MALRDVAKPTLRHLEKEFHTFLYFPLHNGERTCPATARSREASPFSIRGAHRRSTPASGRVGPLFRWTMAGGDVLPLPAQ